jgi:single-stranded DNA-binding protein
MSEIECAFSGVCVKPPELKTSSAGKPFATFSVVIGEGELKKFMRVTCFGDVAERVAAQLSVGGKAYAEGRLEASIWQPQNGEARLNLNCAARRVEILNQIGRNRPKREPATPSSPSAYSGHERPFDDVLPM